MDDSRLESCHGKTLSLLQNIQTGSGAHPASCSGNSVALAGLKRPGREADHSPPFSAKIKNERIYTPPPTYAFIMWTGITLYSIL